MLIEKGTLSGKMAKTVFDEMFSTGATAESIVTAKGLVQVLDESAIEKWVDEVISKNPTQSEDFKKGKTKLMGFFVGEVMKLSKGKANPPMVTALFLKKLGASS